MRYLREKAPETAASAQITTQKEAPRQATAVGPALRSPRPPEGPIMGVLAPLSNAPATMGENKPLDDS
jgi:hypothetical protein